ncbi:MAG: hypothetical protein GY820_36285 [Gammaproteobacteria bacterium]|nr:hypothetical protein [Gammaproteobacteria bacterium]
MLAIERNAHNLKGKKSAQWVEWRAFKCLIGQSVSENVACGDGMVTSVKDTYATVEEEGGEGEERMRYFAPGWAYPGRPVVHLAGSRVHFLAMKGCASQGRKV